MTNGTPDFKKGQDLVQTNDVWMPQHLHDLHLPEDLLQIVVIQLRLVHDFNRHLSESKGSKFFKKKNFMKHASFIPDEKSNTEHDLIIWEFKSATEKSPQNNSSGSPIHTNHNISH